MRRRILSTVEKEYDINNYCTIEALENGVTVSVDRQINYIIGDGNDIVVGKWQSLDKSVSLTINRGQTVSFKINSPEIIVYWGKFSISGKCNLKGTVMSLLHGDNAIENYNNLVDTMIFDSLFKNCTGIINISKNFLPATNLTEYCYSGMFDGCTYLEVAPDLPATTLVNNCYYRMFQGCSSLKYVKVMLLSFPSTVVFYNAFATYGEFYKNAAATWTFSYGNTPPSGWDIILDGGGNAEFTLDDQRVVFTKGETWNSFCNRNSPNFKVNNNRIYFGNTSTRFICDKALPDTAEAPSEQIIEGHAYYTWSGSLM